MSKCIVSFSATGRECYPRAQLRLIKSIVDTGWTGGQLHRCFDGYCDEYAGTPIQLGSWPVSKIYGTSWQHADAPYQFKPFIIKEAHEQGYNQIIWCDSTIMMIADPQPLLDYAAVHGVCAFNNEGFPLADWISDTALETLGIKDPSGIKQIMGCMVIFDLNNATGKVIFEDWIGLSMDGVSFQDNGSNREGFRAHRHDQAVLSGLLHLYDVPILPYGQLCYAEKQHEFDNVIFINKGL